MPQSMSLYDARGKLTRRPSLLVPGRLRAEADPMRGSRRRAIAKIADDLAAALEHESSDVVVVGGLLLEARSR